MIGIGTSSPFTGWRIYAGVDPLVILYLFLRYCEACSFYDWWMLNRRRRDKSFSFVVLSRVAHQSPKFYSKRAPRTIDAGIRYGSWYASNVFVSIQLESRSLEPVMYLTYNPYCALYLLMLPFSSHGCINYCMSTSILFYSAFSPEENHVVKQIFHTQSFMKEHSQTRQILTLVQTVQSIKFLS